MRQRSTTLLAGFNSAELRAGLVQAFGADRVADWEQAAAATVDAKAQRRAALMKKMGQIK